MIQNFGPELESEFAHDSIEIHYAEALQEYNLIPVNRAKIEDLEFISRLANEYEIAVFLYDCGEYFINFG